MPVLIPFITSQRVSSFSAFLPNDVVIYDYSHLICNTLFTLPVTNTSSLCGIMRQEKKWAFSDTMAYTWGQQGSTVLLGSQGSVLEQTWWNWQVQAAYMSPVRSDSPISSSVEDSKMERARKCQDVPLKGHLWKMRPVEVSLHIYTSKSLLL